MRAARRSNGRGSPSARGGTPAGSSPTTPAAFVPLAAVERFEARDDYVAAHVKGRRFLLRVTLQSIDGIVDADRFARIHRSHIVNLDFVEAFEQYDAARLLVRMRDGETILASRNRSRELRELAF